MPEQRPSLYELLEVVRKENNEAHDKIEIRVTKLEVMSAEGRGFRNAITFLVGALGAIGGLLLGR